MPEQPNGQLGFDGDFHAMSHAVLAIAERARDMHLRANGITPTPWASLDPQMRNAWIATVYFIRAELHLRQIK